MYVFKGFFGVQVYETTNILLTDGYDGKLIDSTIQDSTQLQKNNIIQYFHKRMQQYMNQWRPNKSKHKWDVFISSQVQEQLSDPDIKEFLMATETTYKTLRRNLGGIQEICGLRQLAQAIEMEATIAVNDTSIGSRNRAAHGYIVESQCGRYRVMGASPVDCDDDDLESTRAELWGHIAIQTVVNIVCELHGVTTGEVHRFTGTT